MCIFTIEACPYPNHDPVSCLIFDPVKIGQWNECDRIRPWGRFSCGQLEIHHSISAARSSIPFTVLIANAHAPNLVRTRSSSATNPSTGSEQSTELPGITTPDTGNCPWCSTILNLYIHKDKASKADAQTLLGKMETLMDTNSKLRELDQAVIAKGAELEALKHQAWIERSKEMEKFESAQVI